MARWFLMIFVWKQTPGLVIHHGELNTIRRSSKRAVPTTKQPTLTVQVPSHPRFFSGLVGVRRSHLWLLAWRFDLTRYRDAADVNQIFRDYVQVEREKKTNSTCFGFFLHPIILCEKKTCWKFKRFPVQVHAAGSYQWLCFIWLHDTQVFFPASSHFKNAKRPNEPSKHQSLSEMVTVYVCIYIYMLKHLFSFANHPRAFARWQNMLEHVLKKNTFQNCSLEGLHLSTSPRNCCRARLRSMTRALRSLWWLSRCPPNLEVFTGKMTSYR